MTWTNFLKTQARASEASKAGHFDQQITPIEIQHRKETIEFKEDEFIRPDTTLQSLSLLKPVFKDGSVTAGNSSGINDGTASVVLANKNTVEKYEVRPIARFLSYGFGGVAPRIMGMGPVLRVEWHLNAQALSPPNLTWLRATRRLQLKPALLPAN